MEERRKFMRLDASFDIFQIHEVFGGRPEKIISRLKNICREGLRLSSANALAKGTVVGLEIPIPWGTAVISAFSEVIWSEKIDETGYDTGMRFTRIEAEDRARLLDYAYNSMLKTGDRNYNMG